MIVTFILYCYFTFKYGDVMYHKIKLFSLPLLIIVLFSPLMSAEGVVASHYRVVDSEKIRRIETDVITIIFPRDGRKPTFLWWYTNDNSTIHVVHFSGLIEHVMLREVRYFKWNCAVSPKNIYSILASSKISDLQTRIKIGDFVNKHCFSLLSKIKSLILIVSMTKPSKDDVVSQLKFILNILEDLINYLRRLNFNGIADEVKSFHKEIKQLIQSLSSSQITSQLKQRIIELLDDLKSLIIKVICKSVENKLRKLNETLREVEFLAQEWATEWHPPFLPFDSCKWELSEVEEILDENGKSIGLTFSFKLVKAPPPFQFAEDNIIIECRLYFTPVEEKIETNNGTVTYTVNRAELKMDLIIKNWKWNIRHGFLLDSRLSKLNISYISLKPSLSLWIKMTSFNLRRVNIDLLPFLSTIDTSASLTSNFMVQVQEMMRIKPVVNDSDTEPLTVKPSISVKGSMIKINPVKFKMLTDEGVIAGFFKFIPNATIMYHNGNVVTVPVRASYMKSLGCIMLFLSYPYFNGGSLKHDPSIGVDIKVEESPQYIVTLPPETGKISVESTKVSVPIDGYSLIVTAVGLILVSVFLLKYKRKQ